MSCGGLIYIIGGYFTGFNLINYIYSFHEIFAWNDPIFIWETKSHWILHNCSKKKQSSFSANQTAFKVMFAKQGCRVNGMAGSMDTSAVIFTCNDIMAVHFTLFFQPQNQFMLYCCWDGWDVIPTKSYTCHDSCAVVACSFFGNTENYKRHPFRQKSLAKFDTQIFTKSGYFSVMEINFSNDESPCHVKHPW